MFQAVKGSVFFGGLRGDEGLSCLAPFPPRNPRAVVVVVVVVMVGGGGGGDVGGW
jgi:hypothetical protein